VIAFITLRRGTFYPSPCAGAVVRSALTRSALTPPTLSGTGWPVSRQVAASLARRPVGPDLQAGPGHFITGAGWSLAPVAVAVPVEVLALLSGQGQHVRPVLHLDGVTFAPWGSGSREPTPSQKFFGLRQTFRAGHQLAHLPSGRR